VGLISQKKKRGGESEIKQGGGDSKKTGGKTNLGWKDDRFRILFTMKKEGNCKGGGKGVD